MPAQVTGDPVVTDERWRQALAALDEVDRRERRRISRLAWVAISTLALWFLAGTVGLLGPSLDAVGGGGGVDAHGPTAKGAGSVQVAVSNTGVLDASVVGGRVSLPGVSLNGPSAPVTIPARETRSVTLTLLYDCAVLSPQVSRDGVSASLAVGTFVDRPTLTLRARGPVLGIPMTRDVDVDGSVITSMLDSLCSLSPEGQ